MSDEAIREAGTFEEEKHPRYEKGDPRGGKFAPKAGGGEESEKRQPKRWHEYPGMQPPPKKQPETEDTRTRRDNIERALGVRPDPTAGKLSGYGFTPAEGAGFSDSRVFQNPRGEHLELFEDGRWTLSSKPDANGIYDVIASGHGWTDLESRLNVDREYPPISPEEMRKGRAERTPIGPDLPYRRPALKRGPADPATMTAGQINKELDALDQRSSAQTEALIAAGHGDKKYHEILAMTGDPLFDEVRKTHERGISLRQEIGLRYGPNQPHRLPTHQRGFFGPRKKRVKEDEDDAAAEPQEQTEQEETTMPYDTVADLPAAVHELSAAMQHKWLTVFNAAYPKHGDQAAAIAWAAVKEETTPDAPEALESVRLTVTEVVEAVTPLTGASWLVRVMKFGRSLNGWIWDDESGKELLPHLAHAPVAVFESANGFMGHAPQQSATGPPLRNVVGYLDSPEVRAGDGVYATLHIHEDAGWLRDRLMGLQNRGALSKALGLSVDALAGYLPMPLREGIGKVIRAVKQVFSVDLVSKPSADGRLIRATAGLSEEDATMTPRMLDLIRKTRPSLLEGRAVESLTDEQVDALFMDALREKPKPEPGEPKPEPEPANKARIQEAGAEPAWLTAARIREARAMVREMVDAAALPKPAGAQLTARFEGKFPDAAEVEAAIRETKTMLAALSPSGTVNGHGSTITLGAEPVDKYQAGLDYLFGITRESFEARLRGTEKDPATGKLIGCGAPFDSETVSRVAEGIADNPAGGRPDVRFKGLRDAYIAMTGDTSFANFGRAVRVREATTATWGDILGNTLYRRLLMDYAEVQYNEASIATYGSAADFRTKEVVIGGYFVDLSTVAEAAPYLAIADPPDDKVQYAVGKRGNLFEVTMEVVMNDDLRWVQRAINRLGRSARRTLAKFVWGMWNAAGAVYDVDTVAWFAAGHNNLGSLALTNDLAGATEVFNLITKLALQTEQNSGEKLGYPPLGSMWLDVPLALVPVARGVNNAIGFGATLVNNPVYHLFGSADDGNAEGGARINGNALFSDVTDWGVHADVRTGGRESIGVDFLQGRQEPEMFLANQETVGAMFTNDKIQYKIRHIYGGDLIDFRGAAKNIVTG